MTTGINCRHCNQETELSVIEGFFKCINPICNKFNQHVAKDVQLYELLQGSLDYEIVYTSYNSKKEGRFYR